MIAYPHFREGTMNVRTESPARRLTVNALHFRAANAACLCDYACRTIRGELSRKEDQ
jgi:hypothetical protein